MATLLGWDFDTYNNTAFYYTQKQRIQYQLIQKIQACSWEPFYEDTKQLLWINRYRWADMCLGFLLTSDEHFGRTDDTSFTFMHLPSNSGGRKIWSMAITNGNNTETLDRFFMFENECIKYSDFSFIHFEPIVGANSVSVTAVIIW